MPFLSREFWGKSAAIGASAAFLFAAGSASGGFFFAPVARAAEPVAPEDLRQRFFMLDVGEERDLPAPAAGARHISTNPAVVSVEGTRLRAVGKGTAHVLAVGVGNRATTGDAAAAGGAGVPAATVTVGAPVRNPVLPFEWDLYFPDDEAHNIGGTVYLFGSLDAHARAFCSPFYVSLFTRDMRRWESTGVTITNKDTPPRPGVPKRRANSDMLWDSDGFFDRVTGRFHHYGFYADHLNGRNNHMFVADGASPTGPFTNFRWLTGDKSGAKIDGISAQVFQDDDGARYITYAPTAHVSPARNYPVIARLRDPATVEEASVVNIGASLKDFYEGPSLRKRAGTYYFVYAENTGAITPRNRRPVRLAHATAKNILGPYTYRGVFLTIEDMPGEGNIQGSIEQHNGQWFVFYHRSPFGVFNRRALCVEKISFDADGRIRPVKPTSSGAADALDATGGDPIHVGSAVIFANVRRGEYGSAKDAGTGGAAGVRGGIEAASDAPATVGFRYVKFTGTERRAIITGDNLHALKTVKIFADGKRIAESAGDGGGASAGGDGDNAAGGAGAGGNSSAVITLPVASFAAPAATLTLTFERATGKQPPVLRTVRFE
ncbi:MAG: family 43 glycosylhydrolase [Puniceicoccales bacterium]|nr:family 43 glycosylhydrolase [Puniceicoccales bacterium]